MIVDGLRLGRRVPTERRMYRHDSQHDGNGRSRIQNMLEEVEEV